MVSAAVELMIKRTMNKFVSWLKSFLTLRANPMMISTTPTNKFPQTMERVASMSTLL